MKKKYHVVLTPDEPEIIAFKKSIPQGNFSKLIVIIMTESLKDEVAEIPMDFKIEPVIEDVHTKITLPEEMVQKFCKKFGCQKGNLTTAIKKEIKKCIWKNLNFKPTSRLEAEFVKSTYNNVFIRAYKNCDGVPEGSEKNKAIEKELVKSFYQMLDKIKPEENYNGKNFIY